ncbi:M56 family metallopeptidase, partial [Hyphobacterium sp. SN044]|uniref:M56 family metallopeptidase n=1 Tax=Hyphobacterium sp. SN044 TaxID=2912575 RepID=UPI001F2C2F47
MSALTEFLPFALHHLWQGALIALALAAGYAALGRRPGQRLVLGLAAFTLAALAPLATLLPEFGFGGGAPMEGAQAIADAAFDFGGDAEFIGAAAPLARPAFAWGVIAAQAAALIMLAGSVLLALRTLVAAFAAERLRRAATPVTLPEPVSIRFAGIAVRQHAEVGGPMVVGLTRPTILLPEHFTDARTASALAAILEHERAHVSRADPAIALVQKLVLALFWWNPAMHWISARIDRDREMACDAEAVRRCGNARELAITLADEAEARLTG